MLGNNTKIQLKIPETHCVDRPLIGAVIVTASSQADVKAIQVSFYGEAEIEYEYNKTVENGEGQKTTEKAEFKKEKKFEKKKVQVAGAQTFQPGTHTIPFEIVLPKTLPPSFKYKHGHKIECEIKYQMHAKVLKGALKSDTKSDKTTIKIIPAVPAVQPAEKSGKNKFMFGKGMSTVSMNLANTNFKHGEKMVVSVQCANESKKNNKAIKVKIEQKIRLKSGESGVPDYNNTKTVVEAKAEGVGAKRETVTRELTLDISKIPPSVDHPFIDIEYKLKASADYAWAKDPEAKIDVKLVPMVAAPPQQQATAGGNYTWSAEQAQGASSPAPMKTGGSHPQLVASPQVEAVPA